MFEPVERSRAFERVVEQIEHAIYSGRLSQGDHLPSERVLVEQFQVGRSTVREALRILESLGLLETAPGNPLGPRVTGSNLAGLHRILNGFIRLENVELVDLVQYRMISGSAANMLASHLRTDEQLLQMADAIQAMEAVPSDDTHLFAEQDLLFHQAIAEASRNTLLTAVNATINDLIVNLMADAIDKSADRSRTREGFLGLHRQLYGAINGRDGVLAAHLARASLLDAYGPLLSTADCRRLQLLVTPGWLTDQCNSITSDESSMTAPRAR